MIKNIMIIVVFLAYSSVTYGQFSIDTLALKKKTAESLKILNEKTLENKASKQNAYKNLVLNYCRIKTLSNIDLDSIFLSIQSNRNFYFNDYLNFLSLNAGCLSPLEYSHTKKILNSYSIGKLSLDLISIFKLNKFKAELYRDTLENWDRKILSDLTSGKHKYPHYISNPYGEISKYATLASLGDTIMEEKIINLLYDYYNYIENTEFDSEQIRMLLYKNYYLDLLPKSLGIIHTKYSTIKSLELMENYSILSESTRTMQPFCYYYVNKYLIFRLAPNKRSQFLFDHRLYRDSSKKLLKSLVQNIKYQALNNKLPWYNLFDYWNQEKN